MMASRVYLLAGALCLVSFLTIKDIVYPVDAQITTSGGMETMKKAAAFTGPTVKFLYWRVFEEYSQFLHQNFPRVNIVGDNYPPPPLRKTLASILGIGKMVLMGIILFGESLQLWQKLNIAPPQWYVWASQNKTYACIFCFFISNMIEGQLISTGAFEISLNDMPIWSKLDSGRIPKPNELFQIIDNQLKFSPAH